nr:uncharacterized protein LOC104099013 isoform X3 [Nicotiana tomentosiformis]
MTTISNANISFFSPWIKREFHFSSIIHEDGKTDLGLCYQYMLSQKFQAFLQRTSQIVLMAPEEEKTIRRSPLDFPIVSFHRLSVLVGIRLCQRRNYSACKLQ